MGEDKKGLNPGMLPQISLNVLPDASDTSLDIESFFVKSTLTARRATLSAFLPPKKVHCVVFPNLEGVIMCFAHARASTLSISCF